MPRILVVDDDPWILKMVTTVLGKRGHEIHVGRNGREGLSKAKEIEPDLIITDIMMPGVDGIRLFNDLRKLEKTASIPVVAMTSFLKKITRKSLLNMGFNDVITKPVERERLLAVLTRLLSPSSINHDQRVTDETTS